MSVEFEVDYEALMPKAPPAGLLEWLYKQRALQSEALVYRVAYETEYDAGTQKRIKCVEVTCSCCEQTYNAEYVPAGGCGSFFAPSPFGFQNFGDDWEQPVISGESTMCPYCGAGAKAIHIGNIRDDYLLEECWPLTIHAVEGRLVLACWYYSKRVNKAGRANVHWEPYQGYIVEDKKTIRLMGYTRNPNSLIMHHKFVPRKKYQDDYGRAGLIYPWDPRLLVGTTAENSKLNLYLKTKATHYPVSYLCVWQKHRNAENLLTAGAGGIFAEMLSDECQCRSYYDGGVTTPELKNIAWKEKRPAQMLGLTKDELKHAVAMKWKTRELYFYQKVKDLGIKLKLPEDMKLCAKLGFSDANHLLENSPRLMMRAVRYLLRQMDKYKQYASRIDATTLIDYWHMVSQAGDDMYDDNVWWPQNLIAQHDRYSGQKKVEDLGHLHQQFTARYEELMRFAWQSDGLEIRPVANAQELVAEGNNLDHCVGDYAENHAGGRTAIFFIRRTDSPGASYYTLEFDEKDLKVKQNRGAHNCARTKEIQTFEAKWLSWVKAERRKPRKRKKAADAA